jgi:hypothetical protein
MERAIKGSAWGVLWAELCTVFQNRETGYSVSNPLIRVQLYICNAFIRKTEGTLCLNCFLSF